jgi:hypothetical protein
MRDFVPGEPDPLEEVWDGSDHGGTIVWLFLVTLLVWVVSLTWAIAQWKAQPSEDIVTYEKIVTFDDESQRLSLEGATIDCDSYPIEITHAQRRYELQLLPKPRLRRVP